MKRRLMLFLFGGAAALAQKVKRNIGSGGYDNDASAPKSVEDFVYEGPIADQPQSRWWQVKNNVLTGAVRLVNNICPVCGATAKPHPKLRESGGVVEPVNTYPDGTISVKPVMVANSPVNLVRCEYCNAAFWQDAEDA